MPENEIPRVSRVAFSGVRYPGFLIEWILNWIESSQIKIFELNFPGKKVIEYFFELNIPEKNDIEWSFELNFIANWMNESYFESIFAIFDEKPPFFVNFGHFLVNFWALCLFDQYQWFPDYWIELSFELNFG